MKKNSQIHLFIATQTKEKLEKEAEDKGISFSELCRQKLMMNNQLSRIEALLMQIQGSILDD